ncbi:MAG: FeoB-associated Cys-rich membrane protein [Lachnospiraceae bacterium]|nr:FeoB-associated Cys-rich membrane protein [Lachnospiraceae bacterium]
MNPIDIFIVILLVSVVILAVIKLLRDKKRGKHFCGGDCAGCSGCDCHKRGVGK